MPFTIPFTRQEIKPALVSAAIAAGLILVALLFFLVSPALLRLLLLTLWLIGLTAALPKLRRSRLLWILSVALLMLLFYFVLNGGCLRFINGAISEPAPAASLSGDAALLNRHLLAGRAELLQFIHGAGRLLYPTPLELLLALLLTAAAAAAWPLLHRAWLARTPNRQLTSMAWRLREWPRQLGAWVRCESGRSLFMGALWAGGAALLGFSHPAIAGLLMALASPTPFWGPAFAVGLTLFFATDIRHLPLQAGGAVIVFAVTWLASHLLFSGRLSTCRPHLPKGVVLLIVLAGYGLAGLAGFFFTTPILTAAIHIERSSHPSRRQFS